MKELKLYILISLSACIVRGQQADSLYKEFKNNFEVVSLNINGMSPFLVGENIYFAANNKKTGGVIYDQVSIPEPLYDIYTASRIDSITFSKPDYSRKFSTLFNDGPISFDEKETEVLITCNQKKYKFVVDRNDARQDLKIYYAFNKKGKWSEPELHPVCTENGSYCHAVFGTDKNTMIFASDMPGGYGGMDLYITELRNNEWTKPRNLGRKINSAYNEVFPFINKSGIIYFSSDRPNGAGGLDIYSMSLKDTLNAQVLAFEKPVNSSADDFGVWTNEDGSYGYLSSDRLDNKADNLFYFYKIIPKLENRIVPKNKFCYTFFEEASVEHSDTSGLEYEWDFGKGIKKRGLEVNHCFNKPGTYPINLNIIDKSTGDLIYNDVSYDFVVEEPKQLIINSRDTVEIGEALFLDGSASQLEGYSIKKYYWAFNDGWFTLGTKARHEYFTTGLHTVTLGVLAISDSTCKEYTFYTEKKVYISEPKKETGLNMFEERSYQIIVTDPEAEMKEQEKKKKFPDWQWFRIEIYALVQGRCINNSLI